MHTGEDLVEKLSGTVVDHAGNPVEGVSLQLTKETFTVETTDNQRYVEDIEGPRTKSDADGHFTLRNVPLDGGESGAGEQCRRSAHEAESAT